MTFTTTPSGKTLYQLTHEILFENDEELRRHWYGGTTPPSINGQLWADTSTGYLKIKIGSEWNVICPLSGNAHRILTSIKVGAVNATAEAYLATRRSRVSAY